MSNYKRKEVMDYLIRKPVTTQDIELARTRIQTPVAQPSIQATSNEERVLNTQPFYQEPKELVQEDSASPQVDSIPLYQGVQPGVAIEERMPIYLPPDMAPVMPQVPGIPNPQFRQIELAEGGRAEFAEGTRLSFKEKQKTLKDIKKYVDKKLSKKEVVTLSELNEKFGQGQRREYLYREALGKNYDKITKLQREGVGRVSLEVKDKLYSIIDDVVKGKRPLMDLSRNNLNKELPPVSERQLSKYLNENKKYKDYDLASNVDKVQQRIVKGNEKLKDATLKNIESKLELTTAGLRRPSPKRIEEFIVRDLVRHDNQGGELFKVLPKSNTKFYDKIRILDVANDDVLTTKNIKNLVDMGDPRFKEYKETFDEINQLKKTPYINPVTKEETNLLNALQQATGNKQPLNIDHLEGVKDNPLNKLAVSTYKANTGANIKDITEEELSMLGRKKFTPQQNIERLTKFTDRRLLQEAASGFEKVKTPLETLAVKKSNVLFSDPTGIGNFLETSLGQSLSKSAPNLLKTTAKLSAVTGTPINALLGVALYADEFKEQGLSDLETIAAGAYKGSTQDLLNFGDLIIRKLPVATYEKFVENKPFLESLLDKPEYFEFADKQIDKYASEKSIKDRIRNRAEYEVRKSFTPNISDTEVSVTATTEEYENLIKAKENEILNLDPSLKKQYKQETTVTPELKKDPSQNLMLGPIVFPKYTQEELNFARGGRVNFASGSDDPESDLYIPPLDEKEISGTNISKEGKEGIDGLYFRTREEQRPIPVDPMTGKPISSGGMRELKQVFSSLLSDTRPEAGYRKGNIDFYASKGINPFQGDTDFKYGASYTPEGNVGKFMIDKTPQYLGAGYNYQKDGLDFGITGLKNERGDKSIALRFGYNYATGGRASFKDGPKDPSKRRFIKGTGILGAVGIASNFIPDLFQMAKKAKVIPKKAPFINIVKPLGKTDTEFPEWFPTLVSRLRKEGEMKPIFKTEKTPITEEQYKIGMEKGEKNIYVNPRTEEYFRQNPNEFRYFKIKQTDDITGYEYTDKNLPDVKVVEVEGKEASVFFKNYYGADVEINYKSPGVMDEGSFYVKDYQPEAGSALDSAPDFEETLVKNIDEVLGGSSQLEKYATKSKTARYTKGDAIADEMEGRAQSELDRMKDEGLFDD